MTILQRLLPRHVDNGFEGHRSALWLLGILLALLFIVSVRSILSTASVAQGADGLPLGSFGPDATRTVLMMFALNSVGQLTIALIGATILLRYRALVPFFYLVVLADQICRRLVIQAYAVPRAEGSISGWYLVAGILGLLALGLLLSLRPRQATAIQTPTISGGAGR
jgi:hypothetical protein